MDFDKAESDALSHFSSWDEEGMGGKAEHSFKSLSFFYIRIPQIISKYTKALL